MRKRNAGIGRRSDKGLREAASSRLQLQCKHRRIVNLEKDLTMCKPSRETPITSLEEFALPITSARTSHQIYSELTNAYYQGRLLIISPDDLGRLFFDILTLQRELKAAKA
jgi:hypothetical protein